MESAGGKTGRPPVAIEPMRESDLDAVAAIEAASFERPWSRQSFEAELANSQLASYYVARLEGRVVGYGGIWVVIDDAHVTTLAVDKDYRRMGIAGLLMVTLLAQARRRGARRIFLEVRPSNRPARALYRKYGFSVCGVRKRYYQDEDGLVMCNENISGKGAITDEI